MASEQSAHIYFRRDHYLVDSLAKAKMWTLMVNHANYADLVLTPSEHFREKLIHYGVEKEIKVLPNGFLDEKFPEKPAPRELKSGEPLRIIWHSRVSAEKRMMPFLHALKKVHYPYVIDVYGGGGDFFRARRFARRHHLRANFHGNVSFSELTEALANADLDVLVSYDFDTFGMTLIEAEAYGIPVFFCDPDMKEIVPPGSYVMSKNETPAAMATALNKIFKHPETIQEMSQIMLEHRKEILVSNRIKILEEILNSLINQPVKTLSKPTSTTRKK